MSRRVFRLPAVTIILAAASLLLSACLLSPGRFVSELDIRRDGRFTFSYSGELHMLMLSRLAEMNNKARAAAPFEPTPCHDAASGQERACTRRETEEQKSAWEEQQRQAARQQERETESMRRLLGGIDPSSPQAAEELAGRLRRQAGWRSVTYRGDGLFDVDFTISGRLDHDFVFPAIERFPMASSFVQVSRRNDGTVRIDAPGFSAQAAAGPYQALALGAAAGSPEAGPPSLPQVDGRFTIRTDGAILANNTDDGPRSAAGGQQIDWTINARTSEPPMALIRLAQ